MKITAIILEGVEDIALEQTLSILAHRNTKVLDAAMQEKQGRKEEQQAFMKSMFEAVYGSSQDDDLCDQSEETEEPCQPGESEPLDDEEPTHAGIAIPDPTEEAQEIKLIGKYDANGRYLPGSVEYDPIPEELTEANQSKLENAIAQAGLYCTDETISTVLLKVKQPPKNPNAMPNLDKAARDCNAELYFSERDKAWKLSKLDRPGISRDKRNIQRIPDHAKSCV